MSEKMYYVKDLLTGDGAWVVKDIFGIVSGGHIKPTSFTKTELAEVKGGAIYKFREVTAEWNELDHPDWNYNPYIDKYEWINPLIELVPVEDRE